MRSILVIFFAGFLTVYHGINFFTGDGIWKRFFPRAGEERGFLDRSTKLLTKSGYVARYLAGQTPELAFRGPDRAGPLDLHLRAEVKFQFARKARDIRRKSQDRFRRVLRHYGERGVHVLLVPVPSKIDLSALERFPAASPWRRSGDSTSARDPAAVYRAIREIDPSRVVDVRDAFVRFLSRHPRARLFVPWDYHWSSLGIAVTTGAVADHLREAGWDLGPLRLVAEQERLSDHREGLVRHLQLPDTFLSLAPGLEWIEPMIAAHSGKRGAKRGRIVLAGTSFSESYLGTRFSFGHQLARVLNRELIEMPVGGGKESVAFQRLREKGVRLRPGDLLVWEMPVVTTIGFGDEIPLLEVDETPRTLGSFEKGREDLG